MDSQQLQNIGLKTATGGHFVTSSARVWGELLHEHGRRIGSKCYGVTINLYVAVGDEDIIGFIARGQCKLGR